MAYTMIKDRVLSCTAFGPNTELLIDGKIDTIASLVIRIGNADSFALDDNLSVKEASLFKVQARFYNESYHLKFSNGLDIKCIPTSWFLTRDGWMQARDLKVGQRMIAGNVGKTITGANISVVVSEPHNIKIATPFYHFNSKFKNGRMAHNTILPAYSPRTEEITFVCTHQ